MATVTQIEDNIGNLFDIEDAAASAAIAGILNLIPNSATISNKLSTASDIANEETRAKKEEAALLSKLGNYGKDAQAVFDSNFRIEFQSAFDATANYSFFSGGTGAGTEGGWIGFKHTSTRVGAILFNASGVYFVFKRNTNWTWRQII